ncbi:hypothetical protein GNI_171010 [Gregarina niphandrodes]|uniref:Uncharacterized protein n=1 Tax=Gregarina niphandrodes TaxID=110365 RepID=A0A023AXU9_GRENI|nr:hypothetical protein GNI_171010 [Gregarina niphandrodes]EZG43459.1 hypothetical protein GNI_171010 [Gregarina niphandrodes]|eukprot:XP_011133310.1 hypothetical protein GNI_171010 [Gregarina niphandrodes]
MATRSGPTECPDHILAKQKEFESDLATFPSPYALFYFDETAPNNILLKNDLGQRCCSKPDNQKIPTRVDSNSGAKVSKKEAMQYNLRKMFFDVDDIRLPQNGTGLKMLPSYTTSYKNYPAVCYDVVTPAHYNQFFRVRQRPGMFA